MSNPPESSKSSKLSQEQRTAEQQARAERYDASYQRDSGKLRFIKFLVMLLLLAVVAFAVYYLFLGGKEQFTKDIETPVRPTAAAGGGSPGGSGGPGGGPGGFGGPGSGGGGAGMMGGATKVSVVTAEERSMNFVIRGLGTAIPSENVVVRSQVSGPVTQIFFEEGAMVQAGDPLFEIDPRPFNARLQQARGQYQQNEAQLANAEADLRRYQTLFKQNSIARQQVDTQDALVKQQRANRASLKAQIDQAEIEVEYTTVKAPISGRLGLRQVDIGNLVQANGSEGLVTITQTQPMDVEFAVSEQYVPQIAAKFYQGVPLEVQLYDRNSSQFIEKGQVLSMDNQIDSATGTVKIKARFDNLNHGLFPNQFVNAWLYVQRYDNSLSILTDAIQYGRQGTFVFLVNDNMTVQQKDIKVGIVDSGYTQINEGLSEGDRVVVEGVDRLRAGSKVEIVD
ncbi:MAG: efflux RND transporter periplasmic adaptor subunit [Alcaligenaceae bacterium]|nr:efflux RND transporter periplasmic adaptor subunit [Alcaligenaceae bacterium]